MTLYRFYCRLLTFLLDWLTVGALAAVLAAGVRYAITGEF